MADFNIAANKTLNLEGGYQDDPNDIGNYYKYDKKNPLVGTNHGITPSTYFDFFKKVPTVDDMKALTIDDARNIYKSLYWDKIRGDQIKNQSIAEIIFDMAINSYWAAANRGVRSVLGLGDAVFMSDACVSGINSSDQSTFFNEYKKWRINFYQNAKPAEYRDEWIARTNKFVFVP